MYLLVTKKIIRNILQRVDTGSIVSGDGGSESPVNGGVVFW